MTVEALVDQPSCTCRCCGRETVHMAYGLFGGT